MIDFDPDDLAAGTPLPTVIDEGLSLVARPGALSYDYLTSYTLGPIHQGDFSAGLADRIWQVRVYDKNIWLAREKDDRTGFEPETLLTTIPFQPTESDAAFDQSARLFVCMEWSGQVWFYWFNPIAGIFVTESFGPGRSPRCTLDQLTNRADSDLHVFYIRDNELKYRVQRDRYLVEYSTGYVAPYGAYVEDAAISQGGRVVVLVAVLDNAAHYNYERTFSKLLPWLTDVESVIESLTVQSGIMLVVLQTVAPPGFGSNFLDDVEETHEGLTVQSGDLHVAIIILTLFDIEQWHEGLTVQSGTIIVVVIDHVLFDIEQWHEGLTVQSGLVVVIVIVHVLFDIEQWHEGLTVQSGTLV